MKAVTFSLKKAIVCSVGFQTVPIGQFFHQSAQRENRHTLLFTQTKQQNERQTQKSFGLKHEPNETGRNQTKTKENGRKRTKTNESTNRTKPRPPPPEPPPQQTKPSVIERKRRRTDESARKRTNRRTERNHAPPPTNETVRNRTKTKENERKRTKTNESTNRTKPRPPPEPQHTCSSQKDTIGGYYISGTGAWRRYQQLPGISDTL